MYAGRKRRKPAQRAVKQPPVEGAKSNPSKRHRDRLNGELERLASLLPFPEDITASLDKLSILRLSVSYLRAKNFFSVALSNCNGTTAADVTDDDLKRPAADNKIPEGELLLQALNGFVLVITANGTIFYSSYTIQDYLGFHQTDVMHQSAYELVHTEDQQELSRNLHWALDPSPTEASAISQDSPQDADPDSSSSFVTYNPEQLPPENSSFLERSFVCRFRCLLDNSSGFLALNIQGRLKFLHGQKQRQENGAKVPPQLALFAIATPLQPPSILEIRTKNMIFRTKHKLDFTPMACDAKGKIVLGYTEAELRVRGSGYQFIHAADMLYCAENHVRMMKTGESGLTVFRLLTKDNRWKWVQANARLVYKNGKPDYIIATQRPLLDEEGGEHLHKRSLHLPFTFATGEALLYQSNHPIAVFKDGSQDKSGSKSKRNRTDSPVTDALDPGSLLGALMSQDESVYVCQPAVEPKMSFHSGFFGEPMDFSSSEPSRQCRSWNETVNSVAGPGIIQPGTSFDPLLATLDSLSLEGQADVNAADGGCSNGELFGALEGLGLSAEDLELLLLDERMIRVEMDPERVPTLDDLLTNEEILSYIYDSIEGKIGSAEHGGQVSAHTTVVTSTTSSPPDGHSTANSTVQMEFSQCKPPPVGQGPIVHLSQQMQQHLNMQTGKVEQDWDHQNNDHVTNTIADGELLGQHLSIPNGQWSAHDILVSAGVQLEHLNTQQIAFSSTAPEQNGELHQQQMHQQHIQQQQKQQHHTRQKAANLNGLRAVSSSSSCSSSEHSAGKPQWQDFGFSNSLGSLNDTQKQLINTSVESRMDFSIADTHSVDYTVSVQEKDHKQQQEHMHFPFAQAMSSLSQCPPPDTSLEQILRVAKACQQLDHYESSHSKMENGCILDTSYPGGSTLPSVNGLTLPTVQTPGSETLPGLTNPPATSFYL